MGLRISIAKLLVTILLNLPTFNSESVIYLLALSVTPSVRYYFPTGIMAKKAFEAGLVVKPYIKTSLSPGSGVVTYYLKESGVLDFMEKLGLESFHTAR